MKGSASLQKILVVAMILAAACSKLPVGKVPTNGGRLEGDKKPTPPKADQTETTKESEQVVPPSVISGTYLVCELQRDPPPAINQATANCALRDEKTRNKVDLTARFDSHEWKTFVPDLNSVTSTSREMPANSAWHLQMQIKAGSASQMDGALPGVQVSLVVRNANGQGEITMTPGVKMDKNPIWLGLNGEALPSHAIAGGTEHMGQDILSLCRVYTNGGIYPGKLQPHYANPQKSICYSTREGASIKSMADDGSTQLLDNDVLVPGNRPWTEILEWSTVVSGMPLPSNAFVGGIDERGENLYLCRGRESGPPMDLNDKPNDPLGEWTPGYVKASSGVCQHEYYGQRMTTGFQILLWKVGP